MEEGGEKRRKEEKWVCVCGCLKLTHCLVAVSDSDEGGSGEYRKKLHCPFCFGLMGK